MALTGWNWILALTFIFCIAVLPNKVNAGQCSLTHGIGAVFHDFKRIYVVYQSLPKASDQALPLFPAPLKYDTLNSSIITGLKVSFGSYLKTDLGEEVPIISLPPPDRRTPEQKIEFKGLQSPDNVIIYISVDYSIKSFLPPSKMTEYGVIRYYIFRPVDSSKMPVNLPTRNNSGYAVFFPKGGSSEFQDRISGLISRIRPICPVTPPWVDNFCNKEMEIPACRH